jgi:hypothetical protein
MLPSGILFIIVIALQAYGATEPRVHSQEPLGLRASRFKARVSRLPTPWLPRLLPSSIVLETLFRSTNELQITSVMASAVLKFVLTTITSLRTVNLYGH